MNDSILDGDLVVIDIRDLRVGLPVGWPPPASKVPLPPSFGPPKAAPPIPARTAFEEAGPPPSQAPRKKRKSQGSSDFFWKRICSWLAALKKKVWRFFFFLVKSELRSDFHHFFAWKSCWGDWIVKSVCSFFQTSWGGLLIHDLRQASPYQSFVGQDQSPKRAGKWWQFRGHGIKKKGAKTVSFCRKTRGFQKGKLGWKGFGVMKPPKFGQEVGWIMKNYAEEEDWQTTPFFNLSIRSPPSNKKLWDKKHQTQIR